MLAGTVTGYAFQYDREPTPLPPLSQPELRASKVVPADRNTTANSVNVNRRAKTDGDLRKLLLKKPKGARNWSGGPGIDGWSDLLEYAGSFDRPDGAFADLAREDLRRVATTSWEERGEVFVIIKLIQFRENTQSAALGFAVGQQGHEARDAGNEGKPMADSGNGRVYVYDEPHREPGYEPLYEGGAIAQRGDVVMRIWYSNNARPVSEKAVMSLAERQLELL